MNCDGIRGLLSAYVDGELSPGDLLRVEQHLRHCHSCADEVDSLRQTVALVASLDEMEVPAAFHVQLHARLVALGPTPLAGQRTIARRPRYFPGRLVVPAAAAAAVLTIGLLSARTMGNLPGVAAKPGQFNPPAAALPANAPTQVPVSVAQAGPGGGSPAAANPPVNSSANPPVQQPAASSDPQAGSAAPVGTVSMDPGKAGIAAAGGTAGTGGRTTALAPLTYYKATLALTADQVTGLAKQYTINTQSGESFIAVPTAQFADLLKQLKSLPGVTPVGATESVDISSDIAAAQAQVQATAEQLKKRQAAVEVLPPAQQAQYAAQLDAEQQAAADAKTELDTLTKQAETSTIFLQVVNR